MWKEFQKVLFGEGWIIYDSKKEINKIKLLLL